MNQEEKTKSNTPDFNALEQEVINFWEEDRTFEKSLEKTRNGEPYVFYDGPPFATGLPHYGHILASTIKDVMPRYQTMKGRYVRRRWGWDCHGLPIENIVEKKLGISGKRQIEELGVEKFNEACRENVLTFAHEWGKMVKRMGRWVEFDNSYKTMDSTYQESVWWGLKQLWDKELIYSDRKVLLYCSRCETPVSNFEVAMDNSYKDVTENSVYVKFRLLPRQRILDFMTDESTYVLAWTTTPWTLPGNTALHVGPTIQYVLVEQGGEKYIVAKERLDLLESPYEVLADVSPRSLAGLSYEPLYPGVVTGAIEPVREGDPARAYKIYMDDFVATTEGTGVVHSAVMYGEEDFAAGKEHDLPRVDMLDHKGHYLPIAPEFLRGVFFKKAEKLVLEELTGRGLVFRVKAFTHSYPHCWRCSTPLYYCALPAWFINIQKIKPALLKENKEVSWYPEHLKEGRFHNSVQQAPDWNISRNRFWATALPFWRCEQTNCRKTLCVGSVEELIEKSHNFREVYPDYTGEVSKLDLHKPYIDAVFIPCEHCGGRMSRVPEVVDCWVESASMPFAEIHFPFEEKELFKHRAQADFVAEYIAQTRAWFYVMHVLGVTLFDKAPFKNVVTTGTILAEDGAKMSKSLNNYPDPWVLVEKYGMDAIRFYLMQSPVMNGDDFNFSEAGVKEVSQKVNMLLYNVWSFYRMYSAEKLQLATYNLQPVHVLDRWILERLQQMIGTVTYQLDNYNTPRACRELVEFINELSTWYVRRSRDRIKANNESSAAALHTLGYVLARTCQVLAPLAPFLSDYIYRDVTGEESVHLSEWPLLRQGYERQAVSAVMEKAYDAKALEQMNLVRELVSVALAGRKASAVSVRQPLRALAYQTQSTEVRLSDEHLAIVLEELNVKVVDDYEQLAEWSRTRGSVHTSIGSGKVSSVLLDLELNEELRLEGYARELERAVQDLRKKSGLSIGEEIELYYNTQDEHLEKVLLDLLDRKKTYVSVITQSLEVEADEEIQLQVGGQAIWLGIVKRV